MSQIFPGKKRKKGLDGTSFNSGLMKYKLFIKPSVLKQLEKIDPVYRSKIRDKIRLLETDPRHHGSIKLSGEENAYRIRVGKYRIVYEIYDSKVLVCVFNVDHRKDIYR